MSKKKTLSPFERLSRLRNSEANILLITIHHHANALQASIDEWLHDQGHGDSCRCEFCHDRGEVSYLEDDLRGLLWALRHLRDAASNMTVPSESAIRKMLSGRKAPAVAKAS